MYDDDLIPCGESEANLRDDRVCEKKKGNADKSKANVLEEELGSCDNSVWMGCTWIMFRSLVTRDFCEVKSDTEQNWKG